MVVASITNGLERKMKKFMHTIGRETEKKETTKNIQPQMEGQYQNVSYKCRVGYVTYMNLNQHKKQWKEVVYTEINFRFS